MPEAPRIPILPNKYYHIYNRGNNRRTIFIEDADYVRFLQLLDRYMASVGSVLSYALLPNHFHLTVLMKPSQDIPTQLLRKPHTLGNTFGHIQNAYAKYFNAKYKNVGSLFEKRFERKLIPNTAYFRQLIVYHHRNPERHGITQDFRNYFYTSYQEFSNPVVHPHVNVAATISRFGSLAKFFAAHEQDIPFAMQDVEFYGK
ncbi:MAG: hypothetical protein AAF828_12165 [Bacteroidota bacterium]